MKPILSAALLAILLSASGCATSHKSDEVGFWNQRIGATAWGFTMFTPYGPFNLGYLQWQRNLKENLEPAKPSDAGTLVIPKP